MARMRMVTRTIKSKVMVCKVYDLTNDEITTLDITITGNTGLTGKDTLENEVNKHGNYRFLKVLETTEKEERYGMSEVDFLKYAKPMTNEEEEEEEE